MNKFIEKGKNRVKGSEKGVFYIIIKVGPRSCFVPRLVLLQNTGVHFCRMRLSFL